MRDHEQLNGTPRLIDKNSIAKKDVPRLESMFPSRRGRPFNESPTLIENDYMLRKRTPPRQRSGGSTQTQTQTQTNLDEAAAADTEEYLVIQSSGAVVLPPPRGIASVLTSESGNDQLTSSKRAADVALRPAAAETELRDAPPQESESKTESVELVREQEAVEPGQIEIERTYTNFINHSEVDVCRMERKFFAKTSTTAIDTDDVSVASKSNVPGAPESGQDQEREQEPNKSKVDSTKKGKEASVENKVVNLKTNGNDVTKPTITPTPTPLETSSQVERSIISSASDASIKVRNNKLFRLFPSIIDAAARRKNKMEAARERRRMLDESKGKKEKKTFLKRTKKTAKSPVADNYEAKDKTAYVQLPSSSLTAGLLLELAEELKQEGLSRPMFQKYERKEEPKVIDQVKQEAEPNKVEVAPSKIKNVSFDESMFRAEFPSELWKSDGDEPDTANSADGDAHSDPFNQSDGDVRPGTASILGKGSAVMDEYPEEMGLEAMHTDDDARLLNVEDEDFTPKSTRQQEDRILNENTALGEGMDAYPEESGVETTHCDDDARIIRAEEESTLKLTRKEVESILAKDLALNEVMDVYPEKTGVEAMQSNADARFFRESMLKLTRQQVEPILHEITPVDADVELVNFDELYKTFISSIKEEIKMSISASHSQTSEQEEVLPPCSSESATTKKNDKGSLRAESGKLEQEDEWLVFNEHEGFQRVTSGTFKQDEKSVEQVMEVPVEEDHEGCLASKSRNFEQLEEHGQTLIGKEDHETMRDSGAEALVKGSVEMENSKTKNDIIRCIGAEVLGEGGVELGHTSLIDDEGSVASFETFRSEKVEDDTSVVSVPDTPMAPGCTFYSRLLDKLGRWILPLGGSKVCMSETIGVVLGSSSSSSSGSGSINTSSPKSFDSECSASVATNGKPLRVLSADDDDDVFDKIEVRFCGL